MSESAANCRQADSQSRPFSVDSICSASKSLNGFFTWHSFPHTDIRRVNRHTAFFAAQEACMSSPELLAARIRGEYREMPGLRLTFAQACRLWQVDAGACHTVLQ